MGRRRRRLREAMARQEALSLEASNLVFLSVSALSVR
jgi:hypothetical protein